MEWSAVLFDRDGTLIVDKHYLGDPAGVELIPGTGEALGRLRLRGVKTVVISNQSEHRARIFPGIGLAPRARSVLGELLAPFGACLDDERFCPHAPEQSCFVPQAGCRHVGEPEGGARSGRGALRHGGRQRWRIFLFGANAGLARRCLVLTGKGEASARKLGLDVDGIVQSGDLCPLRPNCREPRRAGTRLFAAPDVRAAVDGLLALSLPEA